MILFIACHPPLNDLKIQITSAKLSCLIHWSDCIIPHRGASCTRLKIDLLRITIFIQKSLPPLKFRRYSIGNGIMNCFVSSRKKGSCFQIDVVRKSPTFVKRAKLINMYCGFYNKNVNFSRLKYLHPFLSLKNQFNELSRLTIKCKEV